jgi:hypothetical protein
VSFSNSVGEQYTLEELNLDDNKTSMDKNKTLKILQDILIALRKTRENFYFL